MEDSIKKIFWKFFPLCKIENYSRLSGGVFNSSFLVSVDGGRKFVIRVAPDQEKLYPYERFLMHAEQLVYELCAKNSIAAPKVIAVDDSMSVIDRVYMISEYISGKPLSKVETTECSYDKCYREIGSAVAKFHSIKGKCFGRAAQQISSGGFKTWSETILFEVNTWRKAAERFDLMPSKTIEQINKVFVNYIPVLDEISKPCLAHGDLWDGNILVDDKSKSFAALLDADRAIFGDPEFDFPSGKMPNDSFAAGYGKALDNSQSAYIRRKLYLLLFSLRQFYVFNCLIKQPEDAKKQEGYIYKFLDALL